MVSPATGWGDAGVTGAARADGSVEWCCTTWVVPLPVQAGDVVASVSVPVRDNGASNGFATGGNTVTVMVGTPSADGSSFNVLQYQTTDGSGNQVSLLLSFATPHTVAAGENLQLRLRAQTPGLFGGTPATHNSWTGAATVTGSSGSPSPALGTLQTMQIPPSSQFGQPVWNTSIGSGGLMVAVPMTIGSQITGVRARIADVAGMTFTLSLQSIVDGVATTVATSASSAGTGAKQTLSLTGLAASATSGTAYQAVLTRVAGSGLGAAYWFEVDSQ